MPESTCMLFVYGTLRRDAGKPVHRVLARSASWLGYGLAPGRLYDLGSYAGMIEPASPTDFVRGELYLIHDPDALLPVLDAYEGCGPEDPRPPLYERRRTVVRMDDGRLLNAWVYCYRHPVAAGARVSGGDWIEALREKTSQDRTPSTRL